MNDAVRRALQRSEDRPVRRIDYKRMNRVLPKQKAALTRAIKSGDLNKVVKAVQSAVWEWNEIGAWPDDWKRWENAINDMLPWNRQIDLGDLPLEEGA